MKILFLSLFASLFVFFAACGSEEDLENAGQNSATDTETDSDTDPETDTQTDTQTNTQTETDTSTQTQAGFDLNSITPDCSDDTQGIFTTNISPVIISSCGSGNCHDTGAGGLSMPDGDTAIQRRNTIIGVLAQSPYDGDQTKINNKMAAMTGGSQSGNLTPALVKTWWDVEDAQAAFNNNIQPAIEAKCGNQYCHDSSTNSGQGSGNLLLEKGVSNGPANRQRLLAKLSGFFNGDAEAFYRKMTGATSHGANEDLSKSHLTRTRLETWYKTEDNCN